MKKRLKKILKISAIVLGVLAVIAVGFDIYGRQPYDPLGSDTVSFSSEDLKSGKNTVEYLSNGSKISANLFIPEDYVEGEKRPTVVITPQGTGVKEQTAGLYAEKLSQKGFITLAFDPRGFGESGGHPLLVDLSRQIEDVRSSIDFISTLEQVDQNNIFNLGICAGSGISAYETAFDPRIKGQVMVSPAIRSDEESVIPLPMDVAYIISGFAKAYYAITGSDLAISPVVQELAEEEAEEATVGTGMGAFYYLPGMPGDVPNWRNSLSMISIVSAVEWMDFFEPANHFDSTPLFMVYGAKAYSKDSAVKFYDMTKGLKDRLILEGAGHFDIYWMPEYVEPAVEGITNFINENLESNTNEN
jgi:fermentation-respiration switch protein FrsA (DUF1100 family)